ncbi:type II toxin-antitoxin system VapC family toxin [Cyanobium sp. LEGE 06143]|uniref:type II toxin-antitoxin system VapC family toxin n=1 Tax=Cyanobium sp. LEGE 06143 TaxID=945727 RepID=UPI00351C2A44
MLGGRSAIVAAQKRSSATTPWACPPDGDRLLNTALIDIISLDREQAELARDAFRRYGKGRHRAGLNFGDCFSYALAKWLAEPLLFKGDDFCHTDLQPACSAS